MTADPISVSKAEILRLRSSLLQNTRQFFCSRDFIEVQTPCLSRDNVVDAHIDPVTVLGTALGMPQGTSSDFYYLQSSPEFAMKRLIAQGVGSQFSLGPVFRAGERSHRHNVEFTMLEWYDVGASMERVIEQTINLVESLLNLAPETVSIASSMSTHETSVRRHNRVQNPIRVVSYRNLFRESLGFDPIDVSLDRLQLEVACVDQHLAKALAGQRDDMLDVLLTERIEPLICTESVLIRNYPITQAALARRSDDDPATAERFELLIEGLEIANGYGELLDADELIRRNEANNRKRLATGRSDLPSESRLVDAMRLGLPACSGVALGFDRLVMIAVGTENIGDVLTFPIELA